MLAYAGLERMREVNSKLNERDFVIVIVALSEHIAYKYIARVM